MSLILLHHSARRTKGRFVAHGNSITEAPDELEAERWPTIAAAAVNGGRCDYRNEGTSGYTVAQLNAEFAAVVTPLYDARRHFNVAILAGGTNDLVDGVDGAGLITRAQTWIAAAQAAGFTPFVCTLLARDMGAGPPTQANFDSYRSTYRTWVLANTNAIDWGGMTEASDFNNSTYFKVDRTHPKPALLALMGALVADEINTWLAAGMP